MSAFGLSVVAIGDDCKEIRVKGELDSTVTDRLREAIDGCRGARILISLEACQFIDSTGIAVLVNAHRGGQSRVVAHSPHDQVLRVLDLTGLTADGLVLADREQALSAR